MAEYIEREAYIRIVKDIPMWGSVAAMMADAIPAADVVPVVLCKDCIHWDAEGCGCSLFLEFGENDFCSYGERKEGDE